MKNNEKALGEFLTHFEGIISKADVYSSKVNADVSIALIKKRAQLGMNQKQFADFMGVTQGMISKWENGGYNFTVRAIAEICEKLGCTFDIVIEEEIATDRKTYVKRANEKSAVESYRLFLKSWEHEQDIDLSITEFEFEGAA